MTTKYKYNAKRDFRAERPKLVSCEGGWRWIQGCDELIAGRWEGFVSFHGFVFKTKEDALQHAPSW